MNKADYPRCRTCKHRNVNMVCEHPKVCESDDSDGSAKDQLIYVYNEGGYHTAQDDFGCIHHSELED